jgi:hypothetical protein
MNTSKVENYSESKKSKYFTYSRINLEERRKAALEGDGEAAFSIGMDLMCGVWDAQGMEDDLARGIFKEAPKDNHTQDPYILLAKDPVSGIKFLESAAKTASPENAKMAEFFIAFCREYGLAGLAVEEGALVPFRGFQKHLGVLLAANRIKEDAKSAALNGHPFVPTPMIRPEVENPNTAHFEKLGKSLLPLQFIPILLVQLVALAPLSAGPFYKQTLWTSLAAFLIFSLPILIYILLIKIYAINRGLPVCSCGTMRETNASIQQTLRPECRQKENPFSKTPFLIRNLFAIKKYWFWSLAMLSVVLFLVSIFTFTKVSALMEYLGFNSGSSIFIPPTFLLTFFLSIITVAFDLEMNFADDNAFVMIYKILASPFAKKDVQCLKVQEESIRKI